MKNSKKISKIDPVLKDELKIYKINLPVWKA